MSAVRPIRELLERWTLPSADGDKGDRGTLVLVAGSSSCPGGAILAAGGALRSGSGRVQVLTDADVAQHVAVVVPELLVLPLADDGPDDATARRLELAGAVCIGPGLDHRAQDRARRIAASTPAAIPLLLDAGALTVAPELAVDHAVVVMPNVSEAQALAGREDGSELDLALALHDALGSPVAVRGARTVVVDDSGRWTSDGAHGLGTPGSGDVLAGIAGALLARGLPPVAALGWAVAVHAAAGVRLAGDRDNPGYLARDLVDTIPDAVAGLTG